jgi:hypothetical protein
MLASPAGIAASFTTAGVRADRVGAKLPLRAIAAGGAGNAKASQPLTRETSAGSFGGAAGECAQARDLGATRGRATRNTMLRRSPAIVAGVLFRQGLGRGGQESSSNVASECERLDRRAREGARGNRSRLRRFDRSCSWIVLIAEVDERRLACHRTVAGLVSPPKGAKGQTSVGSRNATAKSCAGGGFPVKSAQAGGGSTRRWKALWPVKAVVFDETAVEAGLASGEGRPGESRAGCRRVRQGRQRLRRQLGSRSKTPWPGDTAGGAVDRGTRQDRAVSRSRAMQGVKSRASRRDTMCVES